MIQYNSAWTLCLLVPLLLGGALVPWLLWLIIRPRLRCPTPSPARGPDSPALGILWYTTACREALGECGSLSRLRRMSEQDIARMLFRCPLADGEEYPTRAQYRTWPHQAELICSGHFEELQVYQSALVSDEALKAVPVAEDSSCHEDGALKRALDRIVFAVSASLLVLALIFWFHIQTLGSCFCVSESGSVPPVPSHKVVLNVPSDQLFAYAESQVSLLPIRKFVLDDWVEALKPYRSVKVKAIHAMTDPIGGEEINASLAAQRGAAVRTLLEELADLHVKQPTKFPTFIDKAAIPVPTGTGANLDQLPIWKACKNEFNDDLPSVLVQPLHLCPGKLANKGCVASPSGDPPSAFGEFELTSRDMQRRGPAVRQVFELMSNERKLIECLAPMRRVVVELEGELVITEPSLPKASIEESIR